MARYIEKGTTIQAPVKDVFAYMANPENMPSWMPGMVEVKNIRGEGTGRTYEWTYKMAGMKFHGQSEWTEYMPQERLVVESEKGIKSHWTWSFSSTAGGDGTNLGLKLEYEIPGAVLGRIAEAMLAKQNEREADLALSNIKAYCEAAGR